MKGHLFDRLVGGETFLAVRASGLPVVLTLLAATLLPLIIYALISSGIAQRDERRAVESATLARAVRITDALDARLDGVSGMLGALATIRSVKERNWTEARLRSLEISQLDRDWRNVTLIDLANNEPAFALQDEAATPVDPQLVKLATAAPHVPQFSGIRTEPNGKPRLLAFMHVPVGSSRGYLWVVTLDPQLVQRILVDLAPGEGVSAVVDRRGMFMARTKAPASRVGKPATVYVRNAIRDGREGLYRGVTYEGMANYSGFYTSRKTGWSTHVAVSSQLIDGHRYGWRVAAGVAGLLGLILAVGLLLIILRFVSARRIAEERIRQSQRLETVGQLTGGIAHDFNNMLAIILGSLDLANRRLADGNADIVRYIGNAIDGANRAAALTHRLLAFSRRQLLAPATVDANALILATGDLIRRTLESNVEIAFRLDPNLWPTFVDAGQLENALVNLAVNARDAMPRGGQLTISTENREHSPGQNADMVAITVTDTGIGMAPAVVERAFEPFFTTKEVGRGTGLGLSQIHGFATQSGGDATIASQPGIGTSVTIVLPRHASKDAISAEVVEDQTAPAGQPDEILLVVEDEDEVRRTSVEALRSLGYTVRHAADAREALSVLETQPGVRLMLTDIVMPGMNGRELAKRVALDHPEVRTLLTTGYDRDEVGSDEHEMLRKPFGIGELARRVRYELDAAN